MMPPMASSQSSNRVLLMPLRRLGLQYLVLALVVSVGGLVEASGQGIALVFLVAAVPFNVLAERIHRRQRVDFTNIPVAPRESAVEALTKSAVRAAVFVSPYAGLTLIGAFWPPIGGIGAGMALGSIMNHFPPTLVVVRRERHERTRFFEEVSRRLNFVAPRVPPRYFRMVVPTDIGPDPRVPNARALDARLSPPENLTSLSARSTIQRGS